jgi:hypothetical protein
MADDVFNAYVVSLKRDLLRGVILNASDSEIGKFLQGTESEILLNVENITIFESVKSLLLQKKER